MALSEFVAIETAYRALQPLDPAARSRAMRWLKDALGSQEALPESVLAALGVEAVVSTTAEPVVAEETTVEPAEAVGTPAEEPVEEPADEPVEEPADEPVEEPAEVAEESTEPATTGRARRRAAASSARKARRSKSKAAPVEDPSEERVYRRMPPAEDVLSAYEKVGTISGLAEHFGVPRHTVQGWARRLRRDGYVIGRGA